MADLIPALRNKNCPCPACRIRASNLWSVVEPVIAITDPRAADEFLNSALAYAQLFSENGWNVGALVNKGAAQCMYQDSSCHYASTVPWELFFRMPQFGKLIVDAVNKFREHLIEQQIRAERSPNPTSAVVFQAGDIPASALRNYKFTRGL